MLSIRTTKITCVYIRVLVSVQQERSWCYVVDVPSIFGLSPLRFGGTQYIDFTTTALVVVRAADVHSVLC